ncbi:hypothetical protein [Pseudoclavibacter sp. 13-3]|uniref:hypothetical protein n=1 Tax=Pseudoclavibacter sp. 13-3 TaxID=2901228 RepID=UPI001E56035C|nr:hypothetical protein [Pseudoclavibacter sp. 13-3]MCD7101177.1 hypothetical protein [Pseudoclavibacter sp. 13-3]
MSDESTQLPEAPADVAKGLGSPTGAPDGAQGLGWPREYPVGETPDLEDADGVPGPGLQQEF